MQEHNSSNVHELLTPASTELHQQCFPFLFNNHLRDQNGSNDTSSVIHSLTSPHKEVGVVGVDQVSILDHCLMPLLTFISVHGFYHKCIAVLLGIAVFNFSPKSPSGDPWLKRAAWIVSLRPCGGLLLLP